MISLLQKCQRFYRALHLVVHFQFSLLTMFRLDGCSQCAVHMLTVRLKMMTVLLTMMTVRLNICQVAILPWKEYKV